MSDNNQENKSKITAEKYWQNIHQKDLDSTENKDEFKEGEFDSFSVAKNRRDFLKIMGFSFTMLPMASCTKGVVRKAIPYLEKSDAVIPGVASWYSTSFEGMPLLVKTREGRPIKIEGNDRSKKYSGSADAVAQASIISLYDSYRLKKPTIDGKESNYELAIAEFKKILDKTLAENKKIILVTPEVFSISSLSLINDLKSKYKNLDHLPYSPVDGGITKAAYNFDLIKEINLTSVDAIISFSSDFLATEKHAAALSRQYADRKSLENPQNVLKHIQIESNMSLTGSNADERFAISTEDQKIVLAIVYAKLMGSTTKVLANKIHFEIAEKVLTQLNKFQNKAVVLSGIKNVETEKLIYKINEKIESVKTSITYYSHPMFKATDSSKFEAMVETLNKTKNEIDAIIFWNVNPFYDYYDQAKFVEAMSKVPNKIVLAFSDDETSSQSHITFPVSHPFESWGDSIVSPSELSLTQPVIQSLYNTLSAEDIFLKVLSSGDTHETYLKKVIEKNFYHISKAISFELFWFNALKEGVIIQDGILKNESSLMNQVKFDFDKYTSKLKLSDELMVELYQSIAIRDGRFANNPWLQELPDPISKVTWDNYAAISPELAKKYNIISGDMIEISVNGSSVVLPALVQPGLCANQLALAVGYGRTVVGKVGLNVGKNVYPLMKYADGIYQNYQSGVKLKKIGKTYQLAQTQTHHSIEGRDIFRETTLNKFIKNPKSGNEDSVKLVSMWGEQKKEGHQWGMAIDLNKCNGCSACVVSCNAENNIPVVGKEEVINRREMHWMRIDRYYKGDEVNPSVAFQPMTCHHCDNAPCETVCPVLATVHSSDGLNQQVYNRCVGTRYCANNCPYKVRRFNWFDYPHTDPNENMVLNPDVAVRSRGVMEKCSMCIQRIQEAKLQAKKEGRPLKDGEIKLACQQSCPSDAIIFGDLSDPESKISKAIKGPRNFRVLEELNIKPRLSYLTKVRNKEV